MYLNFQLCFDVGKYRKALILYAYIFNVFIKNSKSDKNVHIMSKIDVLKRCVMLNDTYIFKKTTVLFFALQNSPMPKIHINFLHLEIYLL